MKTDELQTRVLSTFVDAFGRTPLKERLQDIFGEAIELSRATDLANLREELGDVLSSCIQLANECDWSIEDLVISCLDKIEKRHNQYKSLGRKIKVALLGGEFNPPTLGHIQTAQFVLNTSKTFDEVWLVPCFQHMDGKEMEPPDCRFDMCEIAVRMDGRIRAFAYEITKQLRGETYYFLKRLLEEDFAKNEYDFSYIIGQDNANSFDEWVNYEHLENMVRFVVVPRRGVKPGGSHWYFKPPHIYLRHESPIMEVSSTQVREKLKTLRQTDFPGVVKDDLSKMLPPGVLEYIERHGLYTD